MYFLKSEEKSGSIEVKIYEFLSEKSCIRPKGVNENFVPFYWTAIDSNLKKKKERERKREKREQENAGINFAQMD